MYYGTGPRRTLSGVSDVLTQFNERGLLAVQDSWRAADHFLSMLRGDLQLRALLNIGTPPTDSDIDEHITQCVAAFTRAYRAYS